MQYRLKKDLPYVKAGSLWRMIEKDIFDDDCLMKSIVQKEEVVFPQKTFSDWFEEVDERWKPEPGSRYYRFGSNLEVMGDIWATNLNVRNIDEMQYECGNVFKTRELATEAAKQIKALLKEFHKNNP